MVHNILGVNLQKHLKSSRLLTTFHKDQTTDPNDGTLFVRRPVPMGVDWFRDLFQG